ncbi:MAG: AsmA family protein [Luteimonas sp.]
MSSAPEPHHPHVAQASNALARHPFLITLGVLLFAIIVLIVFWDWNWFKGPIERRVQAQTGRAFVIGGNLDVDLGRITTIRADVLRFGNAPWSKVPTMATADRVELDIEIWPLLLRHDARIPEIRLRKPQIYLETGPKGVGNWVFGDNSSKAPEFRKLWVDDGRLRYLDTPGKTDVDVRIASRQSGREDAAPPIAIDGGGRWKNNRFTINGRAESPLALRDSKQPYRIDLNAQAGATRAHARGTLLDPLRLRDFDLRLALSGKNLEDLYPLIGIATPPSPPYKLDGKLGHDGNTWKYERFSGVVGDSDLAGSASVATGGARPFLRANLVSKRLDFDDLAGFVGAAPQSAGNESTNPELKALAARQAASTRVLPDTPYDLEKIRSMDADVHWKAQRINSPSLPLDDMDAHVFIDNGVLRLDPLNFGVADGDIRSTIRMDAREATLRTNAKIAARGLNLAKLFPDAQLTKSAIGKVGGDVAVAGTGNSIAAMLGTADGDIALGMGRGKISNLLMELAGIDIAESLKFLLTKDRQVPIRCAFGDFKVKGGVMDARALAFDTTDTIIVGEGKISLHDETLALRLRARPKDRTIFALRAPLLVGGTFKDPSFRPELSRVGLRGAIALVLGSIAPPAALLATIDLGGGKDSDCGGHYAK